MFDWMQYRTWRISFIVLLVIPWISHCLCDPDVFECRYSGDCQYLGLSSVCRDGRCHIDLTGNSCQKGDSRACRRVGVSTRSNCYYGIQTCMSGTWSTCVIDESKKKTEICNGRDDDCNGQIDESFPEQNKPCTVSGEKGPCAVGVYQACRSGVLVCLSTHVPRLEGEAYGNCNNGIDDDCDGYIDDPVQDDCPSCTEGSQRECYPYGQGIKDPTLGQGICRPGIQICQGKKWQTCQGAITPQQEICANQIDENCDGIVDNGCEQKDCKTGETRSCYTAAQGTLNVGTCRAGQETCTNGTWGPCEGQVGPRREICGDQLDNDCNGTVDDCDQNVCSLGETRPCYSGATTTRGVGICREGTQACGADGVWESECKQEVLPQTERCGNQKDDDCDGLVDNCQVLQLLSGSWDRQTPLLTWELATGKTAQSFLQGHTDAVYAARFSPDGKTIVSVGHDKLVVAWDADTGKVRWQSNAVGQHTESVYAVALDPSGQFAVTGSEDKTLRLWNLASGAWVSTFQANQGAVYAVDANASGNLLVTGGSDGTVKLWAWNAQTITLQHTLQGHASDVYAVAFDPKGRWVMSGGRDGTVRLWNINGTVGPIVSYTTQGVTALAVDARTSKLAVGSSDGVVAVFDLSGNAPQLVKTLKDGQRGAVYALVFHPTQDELASGYYDRTLLRWNLSSGTVSHTWTGHQGPVSTLAYRP